MNTLKKILMNIGFASILLVPALAVGGSVASAADVTGSLKQGSCLSVEGGTAAEIGDGSTCIEEGNGDGSRVNALVTTVINVFSWVVGVISVIVIIYGGFK